MATLAKALFELAQVLDAEENGVYPETVLPELRAAEMQVAAKVDSFVYFHDAVKSQIEQTKKTIDKFKGTLKTLEALEDRLKTQAQELMEAHGIEKLEGAERSLKLVNAGGVQSLQKPDDMFYVREHCVNPKYVKQLGHLVEEIKVYVLKNKDVFRREVEEGKIEGCEIKPRSKYVRFK